MSLAGHQEVKHQIFILNISIHKMNSSAQRSQTTDDN